MTEIIITSSVLILVIVAVRYLLKGELSVRVQYALWLPVTVRLLVPGTVLASTFSVLNAAPAVELPDRGNIYISDQGITARQPPPQVGYAAGSSAGIDGKYTAGDRYEIYYPPGSEDFVFCPADAVPPEGYTTVPASHILPSPKAALTVIWYIGMAAMGGWFLWVNLSFRKKLRAGRRPVDAPDCPLPVFTAEGVPSPCLVGLFRPAVYVTPACLEDGDRLRHVLAHELAHWRHRDPFWSLVRCVCLTVYWFHPLVWLAASLSRRDCELACDECALRELGEEERTAYGRTLIGLIAVSASPVRLLQTATTMVDRKGGVKERLLFIAKKPRAVALTGVVAVLIAAIAAACTFTGAAEPSAAYATVEEALADLPEELAGSVDALSGITVYTPEESAWVTLEEGELFRGYWKIYVALSSNLTDPLGWMGSVYRMDQAGYDALVEAEGMTGRRLDSYWECFAKDSESYYLIYAPITAPELKTGLTEGAQLQAKLIAWMKSAVLSAEGVEAFEGERFDYTYSAAGLTPDEMASFNTEFFDSLAGFNKAGNSAPVTAVGGYHGSDGLLHLEYRFGNEEALGLAVLRPEGNGYVLVSNQHPIFTAPTNDGDEPGGTVPDTAAEAFRRLLNGDTGFLAEGAEEDAWRDWLDSYPKDLIMLDYYFLDVDADGVPEMFVQYPDSLPALNGVFDFRDGVISCWRFDIMDGSEFQYALLNGNMVLESNFGDSYTCRIFRYTPDGEQEDVGSLAYSPPGGPFGDSGEPASWQVDGQPVTEEEFNRAMTERINCWRVIGGKGNPIPDIWNCRDDLLMDFLLNVADGAYTEAAQHQLGERFLARPGDILSAMTEYQGVETTRWPDFDGNGADWLVSALVSEFKVMRPAEDADRFLAVLDQFAEDDYDGMVRSVREAWDSYVQP